MRYPIWTTVFAIAATVVVSGCGNDQQSAEGGGNGTAVAHMTIPSGTSLDVTVDTGVSSENASVGDAWSGTVVNGCDGIPAGSAVSGTVSAVKAAEKGDRAMLDLGLTSITVAGHSYIVHGGMESITAGSTRARNLGAIAASAGGGALVGKAASGTGKGALIGAIVGGGVATGVVAASDGYQVALKPGTVLTFTTSEALAVRQ